MNSIKYQRYIHRYLIDRLGPSTWTNAVLAILIIATTLVTSILTPYHIAIYVLFLILFIARFRFYKRVSKQNYESISDSDLKRESLYFTFLIGLTGLFWSILIGIPAFLNTDTNFWDQFVYFLATGLIASSLFNIGISKRNFLVFCSPILISLCASSFMNQSTLSGQTIFILAGVIFFFFINALQRKTELFYFEIYNRQEDMIQILEGFPGAISLIKNGRYLYMNKKLINLMGEGVPLKKDDTLGRHNINQSLVQRITEFEASPAMQEEFETDLQTAKGRKTFWVIFKKLQEKKVMILSLDIDEKRNNERKLAEQNIKLIESSKMASLGEMSSGIAHEINNPLTIIQGSTRQITRLSASLDEGLRADFDKLTTKIDLMTLRITKIIKGLRSFAREGSRDPFDRISSKQIIEETLFICESRFKNSNIDIKKNFVVDASIHCRAVQISQVLLNLLNNAYDAIIEKRNLNKEELSMPGDFIEISTQLTQNQFIIKITDSGKGIPKEARDKILNPFFTTKSVGKGTGLGLSISRSIMEEHQGTLEFNFDSPHTEVNLVFNKF
ncbi:MAG: GHKL domain-containing protein [Bdellovibrionaceae bacterium]|nr:GHKL domain-containing protein [Pseudobdellovibrionaceae bacterium]